MTSTSSPLPLDIPAANGTMQMPSKVTVVIDYVGAPSFVLTAERMLPGSHATLDAESDELSVESEPSALRSRTTFTMTVSVPCERYTARVSDPVPAQVSRDAMEDAYEGLCELYPYVPDYFKEKWDLGAYLERARAALALPPPEDARTR